MITYQTESNLSAEEFKSILVRSTLGERRPVDDLARLAGMLQHANLVVTARHNGELVGVSRAITDFHFCTYLSDLAVDVAYQKGGIGKELVRLTKQAVPQAKLILLAAPAAREYYPKIGMTRFEYCFVW